MSMVASAYIDINYFRINYDLDEIEKKYIHVCVCVFARSNASSKNNYHWNALKLK